MPFDAETSKILARLDAEERERKYILIEEDRKKRVDYSKDVMTDLEYHRKMKEMGVDVPIFDPKAKAPSPYHTEE